MPCSRSCPSRADGVVRTAPGGGRTFAYCRLHRPRPPVGPFGLSGQPPVSDRGHPAHRIDNRARSRTAHTSDDTAETAIQAIEVVHAGRPRLVEAARTRTTTTSGRRRRTARGVDERPAPLAPVPEPVEVESIGFPALEGTQRTARAALASLAVHARRPPQGRARQ